MGSNLWELSIIFRYVQILELIGIDHDPLDFWKGSTTVVTTWLLGGSLLCFDLRALNSKPMSPWLGSPDQLQDCPAGQAGPGGSLEATLTRLKP